MASGMTSMKAGLKSEQPFSPAFYVEKKVAVLNRKSRLFWDKISRRANRKVWVG